MWKRLRALLPILLPALERNGHFHWGEAMRRAILAMSASTIDRLLRVCRFHPWHDRLRIPVDREQSFHAMVNGAWSRQLEYWFLRQVFTFRQDSRSV